MKTIISLTLLLLTANVCADTSQCFGTTAKGSLEGGVMLPMSGDNFDNYSLVAVAAGRTYVHAKVRDILVASYKELETTQPGKVYMYGETGYARGGRFSPHKTHQNGLSVDFMTPVVNDEGESELLFTHVFNRFGYDIEFDAKGRYDDQHIDYDAMAAHIVALHKQARAQGVKIWRVIFDPKLQPGLFNTSDGDYLKAHIQFSTKPSWVRHDEHYHVDFDIPCKPVAVAKH